MTSLNLANATENQPQEHEETTIIDDTQRVIRWVMLAMLVTLLLCYAMCWTHPITYGAFRQCDMWGRAEGQSYIGGFVTLFFLAIAVPLIILQTMPAFIGAVKHESAYKPYFTLEKNVSATFTASYTLSPHTGSADSCAADWCNGDTGVFPFDNSYSSGCYGDADRSTLVCVRDLWYERMRCRTAVDPSASSCRLDLTFSGFHVIRRRDADTSDGDTSTEDQASLTLPLLRVAFGGASAFASALSIQLNTTAAWPDQLSGAHFRYAADQSVVKGTVTNLFAPGTLLRGPEPTVQTLRVFPAKYEYKDNDTEATGYLLEVESFRRGSETVPTQYRTVLSVVDTNVFFDLQSFVYTIDIEPHLSIGLATLLALALWTVLIDLFSWLIDAWEIISLRMRILYMAYVHRRHQRSLMTVTTLDTVFPFNRKGPAPIVPIPIVADPAQPHLPTVNLYPASAPRMITPNVPVPLPYDTSSAVVSGAISPAVASMLATGLATPGSHIMPTVMPSAPVSFVGTLSSMPSAGAVNASALGVPSPPANPYGMPWDNATPSYGVPMRSAHPVSSGCVSPPTAVHPTDAPTGRTAQEKHDTGAVTQLAGDSLVDDMFHPFGIQRLVDKLETKGSYSYDPTRERKPWFAADHARPSLCFSLLVFALVLACLLLFLIFYLTEDPLSQL
eukprot:TRINITY_DN393_c0_g1_i2.p1 TRINITY_DN393_c0_g1~~TRINITY_DN393_c0_g1_i2.p1  ORF type:complete len:673 (+),score=112.33 TRINITY_DN393_c0_g1_i2:272-2290(+)